MPDLPRALRALGNDAVVTEEGPYPTITVAPTAPRGARVILTGRATGVPFTAVLAGPERTTTDNTTAAVTCVARLVPRSRGWPIWLWEQEIVGSNPTVPTTSSIGAAQRSRVTHYAGLQQPDDALETVCWVAQRALTP
jgi:hypothetical protein